MNSYFLFYAIIVVVIMISYINHRCFKKQAAVVMMITSTIISLSLIALQHFNIFPGKDIGADLIQRFDLHSFLIDGVLGLLLFAGAITIDPVVLETCKLEVFTLSLIGTVSSSVVTGGLLHYALDKCHISLSLSSCLVFGALISPTDPVAVLSIFNQIQSPKRLVACVAGESLFNDGVGIVLFVVFSQLSSTETEHINIWMLIKLFVRQSIGGILYGSILGFTLSRVILPIKEANISILLTIATVVGAYSGASLLKVSNALSTASMAIILGHRMKSKGLLTRSSKILNFFWDIIDELLNSTLFFLIGFELLAVDFSPINILASLIAIPAALLSRSITVGLPMKFIQLNREHGPMFISVMVWGGLRGALPIALALDWVKNLAPNQASMAFAMTYSVVAFSIIFQGSTMRFVVELMKRKEAEYDARKRRRGGGKMYLDYNKGFTIEEKHINIKDVKLKKFYFKERK